MPTAKRKYISRKEIQDTLGCSKTKAIEIMHMFIGQHKAVVHGRLYRVRIEIFEEWLFNQDGFKEPKGNR